MIGERHGEVGGTTDPTDRKFTDAALREPEEWLRLAQAAGGVGLFDWHLATGVARCSDHLFEVIGRTARADRTITPTEAQTWIYPDDRDRVVAEIHGTLEGTADRTTAEFRLVGEDGASRWISWRGEIRRDAAGRAIRVLGAIQDITSRRRADEQLHLALDRLSLVLRAGRAGLWDWEIKRGPVAFVSPEYRELYGMTADEPVTYDRWLEGIYPEDRARVEAYGREFFARGTTYSIEFRIDHPTRGLRWFGSMGRLYRDADGHPERFSGINLDITALRQAELARRESEERFRKIVENAATGIAITDVRGRFEQCNPAYTALLGYREDELRERELASLVHPEDRAANLAATRRLIAGEVASFEIENRYVRKDGELRWVRTYVSVLTSEAGKPAHLLALVTDTTHRHLEEDALKESDRRKDEFLATLAHELRNPLAPLRTGFEVLKMATDQDTRERARAMMARQLEHMVRLIDDLLDVSRISRGKLELKREAVSLQLVVQHAVETAWPLIEAHRLVLVTHTPDEPVWVDGDLTRLAQVVGNLLNNSTKYTPDGGRIELTIAVDRGQALVQVTDTGVGITPQMLPAVFDLFAQAARDRGRAQGGLGIGLFLVRRIVELHGGTITAESPGLDRGSTFTIRFPLAAGPRPPMVRGRAEVPHVGPTGRRILVVDDNEDAAELLATVLALHGYETRIAHDAASALVEARSFAPEVAVLDIGLPGVSGHELARQLRADPALGRTVLIALTGWGGQEDKRRTAEAGFDYHLTKPVDVAAIEDILARC